MILNLQWGSFKNVSKKGDSLFMGNKIWDSIEIGNVRLNNRIVMPPMSSRLANTDGSVTRALIEYYEARAKGGVGMIIIEYSYIDDLASKAAVCQLGVYSDNLIPGLNNLVERLHYYDTKVFLQVCHGGGQSPFSLIKRMPVAPSPIPSKSGEIPGELTIQEINDIEKAFGDAALRAKKAGFDGVEIHGAHGYLINQFLSPIYNKRTDAYGPDFMSRSKFALDVASEMRQKVGKDFPIGFRLNVKDYIPGGIEVGETLEFIKMLEKNGVDYIHASAGTYLSHQYMISPPYIERGHLEELARQCKAAVGIPVIAVGGINHGKAIEILDNGSADFVAIGRALVADPELPVKLREGKADEIRPCIRCNEGCIGRFFEGKTMRCATNPAAGRESDFVPGITPLPKKVVIIGGGVAGMEVARIAKKRGHDVTILEKTGRLGGNVSVAATPSFKTDLTDLINWYEKQLRQLGIKTKLDFDATANSLRELNPDVIVIAVGANYAVPEIEGNRNKHVITATDVLMETRPIGEKVVILGAGLVGIETAMLLNSNYPGKKITVLELLSEPLADVVRVNKLGIMEKLQKTDIDIITSANILRVTESEVQYLESAEGLKVIAADTVVLAAGFVPNTKLEELTDGIEAEVYYVGDCRRPGKIFHAIDFAAVVASRI
jgi:2,4-dienoyl-CoA reductase-like NADH-dependent reductase (Old Yellow Enzyme family)/thioredoxin reductase